MKLKVEMMAALAVSALLLASAMTAQKKIAPPDHLTFGYVDGDDVVSIVVDGDDVTVLLNDKEMPKDRYRRDGSVLRCMDPHGRPVAILNLNATGGTLYTLSRRPHRMRLGVSLRKPDEGLAEHLGLDPEETLYIADVVEGQAGEKAGLRKYDIITHIDGERPATKERLGEILAEKNPGDKLALRVSRRGGPVDVEVELEADTGEGNPFDQWYSNLGFQYTPQQLWQPDNAALFTYLAQQQKDKGRRASQAWTPFLTMPRTTDKGQTGLVQQLFSESQTKRAKSEDERHLEQELRSLEKRLESLEKVLQGLDKKLK